MTSLSTLDLDVVIVAYGSRHRIGACVERALALPSVREVVVVDHGNDGSAEVAIGLGARVLRDPSNPGFGTGQNRGVAEGSAPFVLLLNPDATPDPAGIAAGLRVLREEQQVGAVQGVITNRATGAPERSNGRELTPIHLLGRAVSARRLLAWAPIRAIARRIAVVADHVDRVPTAPRPVASLAATSIVVRRRAFESVGGFDESYFLYGEDLDLCRRLRKSGWELQALPDQFAWHDSGASSSSATERELSWWRGTMRFSASWWSPVAWAVALLAATTEWARLSAREPWVTRRAWSQLLAEPVRDRRSRRLR